MNPRIITAASLAGLGAALLIVGVWLIYPPAALIVAAGLLFGVLLVDVNWWQ